MAESGSWDERAGSSRDKETDSRVRALIRLLGDEDPKICRTAWDHLEQMGGVAVDRVKEASRSSDDPRVRKQAGRLVTEWARRDVLQEWVCFARRSTVDLEEGAVLISRSEYPKESAETIRREFDGLARVLRGRLATARTTESAIGKLVALLAGELGFSGDEADYEDPDASFLHRVLEKKSGLPILLSVVYLLVARRVGLQLRGVNMPQHFLLKYRRPEGEAFLDPFNNGQTLTSSDCRNYLEASGISFSERYLGEATDREILSRMLGNLLRVYHGRQDQRRLNRVLAMLQTLEAGGEHRSN